jgi:hypothetical protein
VPKQIRCLLNPYSVNTSLFEVFKIGLIYAATPPLSEENLEGTSSGFAPTGKGCSIFFRLVERCENFPRTGQQDRERL